MKYLNLILTLIITISATSSVASNLDCSLEKINGNNIFQLRKVDSGFSGFWKAPNATERNCYIGGNLKIYTTPDHYLHISGTCKWGNYHFTKLVPDLLMAVTSEEGVFDLVLNNETVGRYNTKAGAPYIMWNIKSVENSSIGLIKLSCSSYFPHDNYSANFRFINFSKKGFTEFRGTGDQVMKD